MCGSLEVNTIHQYSLQLKDSRFPLITSLVLKEGTRLIIFIILLFIIFIIYQSLTLTLNVWYFGICCMQYADYNFSKLSVKLRLSVVVCVFFYFVTHLTCKLQNCATNIHASKHIHYIIYLKCKS